MIPFLRERLHSGGCAGVMVNTVKRAQQLKQALPEYDVLLDHAQLTMSDRIRREEEPLQRLGRLHRHAEHARPDGLRQDVCLMLGTQELEDGAKAVHGEYLLARTAALLPQKIRLPEDIPRWCRTFTDRIRMRWTRSYLTGSSCETGISRRSESSRIAPVKPVWTALRGALEVENPCSCWMG